VDENHLQNLSGDDPIPADIMAHLEREQIVREAIGALNERCREMIELLFFENPPIPYEEVARRLRLAKGSIGFIRGRCLQRLRKVLEQKGF
jgi:DNA-directed RNA polymerase specialized sigma24 family protein